ncbi:NADH:flavin oxidoreductase/NADH oxidase [Macrophomina phaseolina]|uniref:NADH:flavin oxidoreductase/NADH oxidase n=1 Tax=Macrophomina phaseolina TaxID=35725 RepID=A0ABQ8GTG9_9PEZI|nr:NADH:flavin oxidoreductase/NADH oxidase [Macrophomina phaseolina]
MVPSKLFTPMRICNVDLKHRIVMAPLTRFRNDASHVPLPMAVEYYRQRASVPGTLIISEATQISSRFGGVPHAPGIQTPEQITRWKEIVDAVHASGCAIVCQLWAPGRAADPKTLEAEGGHPFLSASAVPMEEGAQVPREMTEEEILDCIHDFGVAARNAIEAGFDGVEIHGANGYLVDQFLQDTCNKRADAWGGNVEKRAKFALEVTKNVVEAAGLNKVGIRLSPFSTFQGMRMQDPVPQFTHLIERLRDMKLAYLHVVESRVNNIQDVEKTEGIEFALEAWGKDKPVLVAGGFKPDSAKKAVDEEYKEWDVGVVFGRYFVSTPDLVYRLEKGLEPNPYDRSTFYTPMTKKGYLDYPFSEEFWRSRTNE